MDAHPSRVRKILADRKLAGAWGEIQGERLVRVPRGHAPDHEAGDLLRLKQWFLRAELPRDVVASPRLLSGIVSRFRAAAPFVEELNDALAKAAR